MEFQDVLVLIGGIALFIYGITIISKSLEGFAYTSFRRWLNRITSRPGAGVILGAVFTAIIQSSSATTVTVVSLVNSGMLSFENTLGIIFGANIGTTMTAQIIAFNLGVYGLPIFAVGFLIYFISKKDSIKSIGNAILGFGLIFVGIQFMESAVAGLSDSPYFINLFIRISKNPILGVLVSAVFTAIGQSSSVTVGIVEALGAQNLISLDAAFALVIGANIGTTVTALLASIGTNVQGRRVAVSHVLFNLFGAMIFLIIFRPFINLVSKTSSDLVRQIANAHTLFNVICTLFFLPFVNIFAKTVKKIVPGEALTIEEGVKYLDKRLLNMPSFALDALRKEVSGLREVVHRNMCTVFEMIEQNSGKLIQKVNITENAINSINRAIQSFAPLLVSKSLPKEHSIEVNFLINVSTQLERIGDILRGTAELEVEKVHNGIVFSDAGKADLSKMLNIVRKEFELLCENFENMSEEVFYKIEGVEQSIDRMEMELRDAHVARLMSGVCLPEAGIIYVDILSDLERISDHIYKIARLVLEFHRKEQVKERV